MLPECLAPHHAMKQVLKGAFGRWPVWQVTGVWRPAGCAVLTYHRVGANRHGFKTIAADTFRQQMLWLREHCTLIAPGDFPDACASSSRVRPPVLITFDDAYRDYHDVAYPILRELRIPAVNFVATAFADAPDTLFWWDQVDLAVRASSRRRVELPWRAGTPVDLDAEGRERLRREVRVQIWSRPDEERDATIDALCTALDVRRAGLRIDRQVMTWEEIGRVTEYTTVGAHTHTHPLVSRVEEPRLRREVATSIARIAAHGAPPTLFAYPAGATSDTARRVLAEAGLRIAFTGEPGFNDTATDFLMARRFNAPATAGHLPYMLSGIAARVRAT